MEAEIAEKTTQHKFLVEKEAKQLVDWKRLRSNEIDFSGRHAPLQNEKGLKKCFTLLIFSNKIRNTNFSCSQCNINIISSKVYDRVHVIF